MLLVVAVVALLPLAWFFVRRRFTGAVLAVAYPAGPALALEAEPVVHMQPMPAPRAPRTLGEPPVTRRREPNLLLSREDIATGHLHRAVELSAEDRQGSAMAEFLLALRNGASLDVAALDQSYTLTLTGYLALSRAQVACGLSSDAIDTLRYAVAALPNERILHLALRQLDR
jgi:hypothetical protein